MATTAPGAFQPGAYAARLIVAYTAWLVNGTLALLVVPLVRTTALDFVVITGLGPWPLGVLDKAGVLVVAAGWLVWVIATESLLRAAAGMGGRRLGQAVAGTLAATAAVILFFAALISLLG